MWCSLEKFYGIEVCQKQLVGYMSDYLAYSYYSNYSRSGCSQPTMMKLKSSMLTFGLFTYSYVPMYI